MSPTIDHTGRRALVTITAGGREQLRTERAAGQDWLAHAIADHLDRAERARLAAAVPLLRRLDSEDVR